MQVLPMTVHSSGLEEELASLHASSFGWALVCSGWDHSVAEEILQQAYLKALEGKARFDGHSGIRTWFFGVIKRTAAEDRRVRAVRGLALERWWKRRPRPEPTPNPEGDLAETQAHYRLRRLLGRLSDRQRELLHLVFYQDLTIEQAAGVLGISVGSARTHYQRGKQRLRALLEEGGGER